MIPTTIINGEISNQINIHDRGLQYGDGLFETIALSNNKLLLWYDHLQRLNRGCKILGLPLVDEQQWLDDIQALNIKQSNAVIKLILTRGQGGRGYRPPGEPLVTRIVSFYNWPDYPEVFHTRGITCVFCKTNASINTTLAGIKHLNRLENVLARNEWQDEGIYEGFMLDNDGHVIEGTMSNIFAVSNNVVYTPDLCRCGVKGVVRNNIIKLANNLNIEVNEIELTKELLLNMDEIFVTNSVIGIFPVKQLNKIEFKPGKTTMLLKNNFDMSVDSKEI